MIRVVIVEDHVSYAQALGAVIDLTEDVEVVGATTSASDATSVVARLAPDVAIVDLDLPGGSGIEVIDGVRRERPSIGCVVLTALTDEAELGRAVEAGAAAVLHKSVDVTELLDVVRRVASGQTVLHAGPTSAWLRTLAAERERGWLAQAIDGSLTRRERQILRLLAAGQGGPVIAAELGITQDTVQTHVRNLLGKLGVGTRLEAVALALRLGLVSSEGTTPP
ncbi:MAG TPA: response regulator transcription factor [Euzebyales bacterium]